MDTFEPPPDIPPEMRSAFIDLIAEKLRDRKPDDYEEPSRPDQERTSVETQEARVAVYEKRHRMNRGLWANDKWRKTPL